MQTGLGRPAGRSIDDGLGLPTVYCVGPCFFVKFALLIMANSELTVSGVTSSSLQAFLS